MWKISRHYLAFTLGIIVFGIFLGQMQKNSYIVSPIISSIVKAPKIFTDSSWTLIATGDVIPARSVNYQMITRNDFVWPVRNISDFLKSGDITLINLESPLIKNCPVTNEGMIFCGDQRFVSGLTYAGVDVVNLANNHTLNYGWDGIEQTEKLLAEHSIFSTGFTSMGECAKKSNSCSSFYSTEINGTTVGFLGYNFVGVRADRDALAVQIKSYDLQVDVLIVSLHWGAEYTRAPVGAPDNPRDIALLVVKSGADVVIGNHPHWIQGMEYIDGKPVFYALGNTVFDQEWSKDTKQGIIAKLNFDGSGFKDFELYPVGIYDYGQAVFLSGKDKQDVLNTFEHASKLLYN